MDSSCGKLVIRFQQLPTTSSPPFLSHTPCGLSSLIQYHFSEPRPMNDHCPFPNLFAYRETSLAFARHSFSLSFDPQEMSLNMDINYDYSCVLILGRYSTRIPLARRRFCQSFCILEKILTIPIFVPMHRSIGGYRESYQDTTQIPKRR